MNSVAVKEIAARVAVLSELVDDPEQAHFTEDSIYVLALRHIEASSSDPIAREVAHAALAARLQYERWYA